MKKKILITYCNGCTRSLKRKIIIKSIKTFIQISRNNGIKIKTAKKTTNMFLLHGFP